MVGTKRARRAPLLSMKCHDEITDDGEAPGQDSGPWHHSSAVHAFGRRAKETGRTPRGGTAANVIVSRGSGVVVHREFERRRAQTHLGGLLALDRHILLQQIHREDLALEEEGVVALQGVERLIQ